MTAAHEESAGGQLHRRLVSVVQAGLAELVRNDASFGVVEMTLRPTGYSWSFVPAPGYTFHDSGSANCV